MAGGLGVSPRYNSHPFLVRNGAGRCSKGLFSNLLTACGKGSPEGRCPFGGGLGVSPRYNSHPFLVRNGAGRCSKGLFSNLLTACGKGSPEGRCPFGGGLGVSPRYNFRPFLARNGAGRRSNRVVQQPAGGSKHEGIGNSGINGVHRTADP